MRKQMPRRWQLVAVCNGGQELRRLEPPLSIEVRQIYATYIEGSPAGEQRVVYRLFEARTQSRDIVAVALTEEQAVARQILVGLAKYLAFPHVALTEEPAVPLVGRLDAEPSRRPPKLLIDDARRSDGRMAPS